MDSNNVFEKLFFYHTYLLDKITNLELHTVLDNRSYSQTLMILRMLAPKEAIQNSTQNSSLTSSVLKYARSFCMIVPKIEFYRRKSKQSLEVYPIVESSISVGRLMIKNATSNLK
jgi:hypothetical protein